MLRFDAGGELFGKHQLSAFELGDLLLVGRDDGRVAGLDDPLQQAIRLRLDLLHLALEAGGGALRLHRPLIPGRPEHRPHYVEQARRRLQGLQEGLEFPLDLRPRDRLAGADAAARVAKVVGMQLAGAALRPAGGERAAAIGAGDRTAQDEVGVEVLAVRRLGRLRQTPLDALEDLQRDQRLVVALAARDVPAGRLDIAGIDRPRQDVGDALGMDLAALLILREFGMCLQEALDLYLRREAAGGEAFEGLGQDRGERLATDQHAALTGHTAVHVADRTLEHVVAVEDAGTHPTLGLLGILLALVLRGAGEDVLAEHRVRIVPELDARALQNAAGCFQLLAQVPVARHVAREAADVVDDDDAPLGFVLAQERKQRKHHRAVLLPAGQHLAEDFTHLVAVETRILAAGRFL